ncbi:MAG: hypothetical protein AAF443_04085 [Chlamydiota bacterium]
MRVCFSAVCIQLAAIGFFFNAEFLWGNSSQVTNLLDSGVGSFREALLNAEEDDCLVFDGALSGTITLLSPLPSIDEDLKILGPPSGAVTISGNNLFPIFQVGNDCTVIINDLQLTAGATGGSGAALFIGDDADVVVSNSSITNCAAAGSAGGAIHIGAEAMLRTNDVTYSGNTSGGSGNDVFLSQGSTFKHFCSQDNPAIDIFGEGQVVKQGSATATFNVSKATPLTFTIEEGMVIASGVRTGPSFVFGKLMGGQTSLYIANHGLVKPSKTIGTMISTGNYYQDKQATLEISVSPEASDLLQVGGDAYLCGILSIIPEVGTYAVGTTYTILEIGGGISGPFDAVVSSGSMAFVPHYLDDRITIEITSL